MPQPSARLSDILPSGKDGWEVHVAAQARLEAGEDVIMLSVGDHDFPTPDETVEACVKALRAGHHHYTQLAGIPRLRTAMAKASERSTGIPTAPEEVIATPGGQAALFAAAQAVLDAGQHAIVVAPYYATYPYTFRAAGVSYDVVEAQAEDDFQPRAESIRQALRPETRAILLNSPNNPTGAIYSREALEGIAQLCIEHDLWLVSDEVYWTLGGAAHLSPRALPGMAERTIVMNSLSKSHGMTGWRIGWLTAPARIVTLLTGLNLVSTYGLPDFVSHAAAETLEHGFGVEEIAKRYAQRRQVFLDAAAGMRGITVRGSKGGMYVMLDIRELDPDDEGFAFALLEAERVGVMPGSSFGEAARGHIRVCLCQPEKRLKEAAERIRRFCASYERPSATS